jgi:hypothetical protein
MVEAAGWGQVDLRATLVDAFGGDARDPEHQGHAHERFPKFKRVMKHTVLAKRFPMIGSHDNDCVAPPGLQLGPIEKPPQPEVRVANLRIVAIAIASTKIGAFGVLDVGLMRVHRVRPREELLARIFKLAKQFNACCGNVWPRRLQFARLRPA